MGKIRGKWRGLSLPHAETQGRERKLDVIKREMSFGEAPFSGVCSGLEQIQGQGPSRQGCCTYQHKGFAVLTGCPFEELRGSFSPLLLESTRKEGMPSCHPVEQSKSLAEENLTNTMTLLCTCVCVSVSLVAALSGGPGAAGAEGFPALASPAG